MASAPAKKSATQFVLTLKEFTENVLVLSRSVTVQNDAEKKAVGRIVQAAERLGKLRERMEKRDAAILKREARKTEQIRKLKERLAKLEA